MLSLLELLSKRKKNKHIKNDLLFRSKLNSTETILPKELIDSDTSHEEFTLVINEEQSYLKLKQSIRTKESQIGDIERID